MRDGVLRPDIKRLCGTRKLGHYYLIGSATIDPCHVLPFPIEKCPVCGHGYKPFRGIRFNIDPELLFGDACKKSVLPNVSPNGELHCEICSVCSPHSAKQLDETFALMWINGRVYSPETFFQEAYCHGVCLQISEMPKQLKGLKWDEYPEIFLAHKKAYHGKPGIFMSFGAEVVQKLVPDDTPEEELEKLRKDNVEPVLVKKEDPQCRQRAATKKNHQPALI